MLMKLRPGEVGVVEDDRFARWTTTGSRRECQSLRRYDAESYCVEYSKSAMSNNIFMFAIFVANKYVHSPTWFKTFLTLYNALGSPWTSVATNFLGHLYLVPLSCLRKCELNWILCKNVIFLKYSETKSFATFKWPFDTRGKYTTLL